MTTHGFGGRIKRQIGSLFQGFLPTGTQIGVIGQEENPLTGGTPCGFEGVEMVPVPDLVGGIGRSFDIKDGGNGSVKILEDLFRGA